MQSLRNKRGSETKSGTKDAAEADADVTAEEKHQVVMATQSLGRQYMVSNSVMLQQIPQSN